MLNTTCPAAPARLPAKRGLQWFLEVARAVRQRPLLWLPAALVVAAAQNAVLAVWFMLLAAAQQPGVRGFSVAIAVIMLTPIFLLCSLPLPVAVFSGAAGRQFFPDFQGAHALRRLLHALALNALLAALLFVAYVGISMLWLSVAARFPAILEIGSAVCLCFLAISAFWLTFFILLAQVLTACGTPFFSALAHAARAALSRACLKHAAALAVCTTGTFAALAVFDSLAPHAWLLALACAYAFALDALITPWLMARDMFSAAAE